jgi:hypothetical protein
MELPTGRVSRQTQSMAPQPAAISGKLAKSPPNDLRVIRKNTTKENSGHGVNPALSRNCGARERAQRVSGVMKDPRCLGPLRGLATRELATGNWQLAAERQPKRASSCRWPKVCTYIPVHAQGPRVRHDVQRGSGEEQSTEVEAPRGVTESRERAIGARKGERQPRGQEDYGVQGTYSYILYSLLTTSSNTYSKGYRELELFARLSSVRLSGLRTQDPGP